MVDVVIIGAGHAGTEAALAASRGGAGTALISFSRDNVGQMSCNPSIGGVGKGHLVREVDVFEGVQPAAAAASAIHHRMLNRSKGAAVQGPRIQADRKLFAGAARAILAESKVQVIEGDVTGLLVEGAQITGVELADGRTIPSKAVVVATGTFLGGRLFRGTESSEGGRIEERAATRLGDQFRDLGLVSGRLKTGTPPRLDGRTIAWAKLDPQPSDEERWSISIQDHAPRPSQLACAITRTNPHTHDVIAHHADRSPLYSGEIEGRGPRYCPSIEDKVRRFSDRDSHQLFLEPEGLDTHLVYPNGISTSLPLDAQREMMATIEGLEKVSIVSPGYAVEYAFCDPRSLRPTLHHKEIEGLFMAGQINGTTGYEEASALGLVAGLNAAAHALGSDELLFDRRESYIGVLVDDLTLHGVSEPYRMLTARAERRLHLRADNAIARMAPLAMRTGISASHRRTLDAHLTAKAEAAERSDVQVEPGHVGGGGTQCRPLSYWISRVDTRERAQALIGNDAASLEVGNDLYYAPYVERQERDWSSVQSDRTTPIPAHFDFARVPGLSSEMVERLSQSRPETLDRASRINGVTPTALTALHFALRHAS